MNRKEVDYMFKKDTKKDSLDVQKINEGVLLLNKMLKVLFFVLIVVAIMIITYVIKEWKILVFLKILFKILSPLFIGIVIAWLFNPIVKFLTKHKVNRVLATIIVYSVFLTILVVILVNSVPVLTNQLNDFINIVPTITENLNEIVDKLLKFLEPLLNENMSEVKQEVYSAIIQIGKDITVEFPDKVIGFVTNLISGLGTFVVGLFIGLYMLFDFDNVSRIFISILPNKAKEDARNLIDVSNKTLVNYIQGILFTMTLVFIGNAIGFSIGGLKASILFALFCGVTNAIPYVGPYIGGIPAVIVGFTQSVPTGIIVLVSLVVVQLLDNVIFTPLVQSKGLKLHPVTIIIGLLVFGQFFGILGMILAVPCIAVIKTIFSYFNEKYEFIKINNQINDEVKMKEKVENAKN
ncbi:MAG: AI-2E family transporter [Bacilli bacterium]|nr:AI-2E family transporter [Bacilli bacterium]MBP3635400.1 AI-2E family transporter [Bacilli bacterium]